MIIELICKIIKKSTQVGLWLLLFCLVGQASKSDVAKVYAHEAKLADIESYYYVSEIGQKIARTCLVAGTPISMADGTSKNIEDIVPGDKVLGFDEETGEIIEQTVKRIETPIRDHYVTVTFEDGTTLGITDDHRMYSLRGWGALNAAKSMEKYGQYPHVVDIGVGDSVRQLDGTYKRIVGLEWHYGDIELYDLIDVGESHNYFASGLLVHNCGNGSSGGGGNSSSGGGGNSSSGGGGNSSSGGGGNSSSGGGGNSSSGGGGSGSSGGNGSSGGSSSSGNSNRNDPTTSTPGSASGQPGTSPSNQGGCTSCTKDPTLEGSKTGGKKNPNGSYTIGNPNNGPPKTTVDKNGDEVHEYPSNGGNGGGDRGVTASTPSRITSTPPTKTTSTPPTKSTPPTTGGGSSGGGSCGGGYCPPGQICPGGYTPTRGGGPNYLCASGVQPCYPCCRYEICCSTNEKTGETTCSRCCAQTHCVACSLTCYKNCTPSYTCSNGNGVYFGVYKQQQSAGCGFSKWCLANCPTPVCTKYPGTELNHRNDSCGKNPNMCWHCNKPGRDHHGDDLHDGVYQCIQDHRATPPPYKPTLPDYDANVSHAPKQADCGGGSYTPPDPTSSNVCHIDRSSCCHVYSCPELNSRDRASLGFDISQEWGDGNHPFTEWVFRPHEYNASRPELLGYAGLRGYRCGKYYKVSRPWWTVGGTNLFAGGDYQNRIDSTKYSTIYGSSTSACGTRISTEAGIAMSNVGGLPTSWYRTQRPNNNLTTSAGNVGFDLGTLASKLRIFDDRGTSRGVRQDFTYFKGLVDYDGLKNCLTETPQVTDGVRVCRITPRSGTKLLSSSFDARAEVVFVDGDLTIDRDIPDNGNFRMFVVSGKIIISSEVGTDPWVVAQNQTHYACTPQSDANLNGIFIADKGIEIAQSQPLYKNFNHLENQVNRIVSYCDRQLVVAGSLISYQGNLVLNRSFRGCVLKGGAWETLAPDMNATIPAYIFYPRNDWIANPPDFLKTSIKERYEVQ